MHFHCSVPESYCHKIKKQGRDRQTGTIARADTAISSPNTHANPLPASLGATETRKPEASLPLLSAASCSQVETWCILRQVRTNPLPFPEVLGTKQQAAKQKAFLLKLPIMLLGVSSGQNVHFSLCHIFSEEGRNSKNYILP